MTIAYSAGRIRHGRQGAKRAKSFVGEVMRAAKKAGHTGKCFGAAGAKGHRLSGAAVALRLSLSSRRPASRRDHDRISSPGQGLQVGAARPPHAYLKREGVTRDGQDARMFDATSDVRRHEGVRRAL